MSDNAYVELTNAVLIRSTDKAGLFDIDDREIWIPWSLIEENENDICHDHEEGSIHVAQWLAEREKLV